MKITTPFGVTGTAMTARQYRPGTKEFQRIKIEALTEHIRGLGEYIRDGFSLVGQPQLETDPAPDFDGVKAEWVTHVTKRWPA
jgi:hypothetical protein